MESKDERTQYPSVWQPTVLGTWNGLEPSRELVESGRIFADSLELRHASITLGHIEKVLNALAEYPHYDKENPAGPLTWERILSEVRNVEELANQAFRIAAVPDPDYPAVNDAEGALGT